MQARQRIPISANSLVGLKNNLLQKTGAEQMGIPTRYVQIIK